MAITLAVDAMGGDHAPHITIEGLNYAHQKHPDVLFKVFGDSALVLPELHRHGLEKAVEFIPCTEIIKGETDPRQAIRGFKDSSMRRAIESVAQGDSQGVVSAGNTGAYMALSKLILKTLPGVQRPAITTIMPTKDGRGVVMLDLGANVDVSPEGLVQFCLMGQAFAKCVQGKQNPSVALLNIGSEALKGTATLKETQNLIQTTGIIKNYQGFVEGDDIFTGKTDVIVTDGFTGNVALKTAEGTVRFFTDILRKELKKNWLSKLGVLLAGSAFKSFKEHLDPRQYNGAQFLGLCGVSVKSHGGTDGIGFSAALRVAIELIRNAVNEKIQREISHFEELMTQVS